MDNQEPVLQTWSEAPQDARSRRVQAALVACAILALPVFYLVHYYIFPGHVLATSAAAAAQASPEARLNLAASLLQNNQPMRALPLLESLVAEQPGNSIAWNDLGVAHIMLQEYAMGIAACQKALALNPSFQLARNNLKWAEDEQRKTQVTLAHTEQTDPTARDRAFYVSEGMNFLHAGNYDQAIAAWQRALQIDPRDAVSANDIGVALMYKHQPAAALRWFQRALTLAPEMQLAKNNLAWAQDELRKSAAARSSHAR